MNTTKPRILYIATFPPPIHGSAVVSMQIKNSKVINDVFDGDYVNLATTRSMTEPNNYALKLWRTIQSFSCTFGLLLTRHYDLCYCAITISSACFFRDAPYVLLCKLFRKKILIHQHNKGMSLFIDKPIYRWLYPLTYKNVKVILLSRYLYHDIERVVKKENIMVCPNGIKPSQRVPQEFKDIQKFSNRILHIFFLSNLLVDKGVLVLLDALEILKNKRYSFVCDIVGDETKYIDSGRLAQEIENRGLNKIAIYHGKKYGLDKIEFWNNADIFTLPSFNEAFPLVNLEAMEQGLPIVTTNVGGIPDEVLDGVNGFIVPPQDSNSLADALQKLLGNEELRKRMGNNSRKIFLEKYTEEKFENNMLSCLKSMLR